MSTSRVIAEAASLVCKVLNTKCPVNAARTQIDAVSVTDFTDHDHVRVTAQKRPQGRGEGKPRYQA